MKPARMVGGRSEAAFDGPTCRTLTVRRGVAVVSFFFSFWCAYTRSILLDCDCLGCVYFAIFERWPELNLRDVPICLSRRTTGSQIFALVKRCSRPRLAANAATRACKPNATMSTAFAATAQTCVSLIYGAPSSSCCLVPFVVLAFGPLLSNHPSGCCPKRRIVRPATLVSPVQVSFVAPFASTTSHRPFRSSVRLSALRPAVGQSAPLLTPCNMGRSRSRDSRALGFLYPARPTRALI